MFGFSQKITDPSCGMKINKADAKFSSEADGKKYYFCSQNCKTKFDSGAKKNVDQKETKKESCCG